MVNSQRKYTRLANVDFNKVDMKSKTELWTDDMTKSIYIPNDGKVTNVSHNPISEPLRITTKRTSVRNQTGRRFS